MRGVPAWQRRHSVQHPSTVLALRANPPSPARGAGELHLPALAAPGGGRRPAEISNGIVSHAHSRPA
ncbi:MAG: hypothetical protein EOR30_13335 [Mesorhizobium sp.]|nr:hypothetical protein EOA78_29045 [Mesorhizobium sp. M5C.F.Cr.IN.023.01.1.1]RWF89725.1 MAG: hypothetical protein EOQ45_30495 [Mesorhizobium sp.]RWI37145.1 MAG: hypothetical protein EOR14_24810 [Mesorhizobium sp.]RWI45019.1 MAG: hypothetical protein EOR15_23500 [Mesorhizobium sp.]RWI55435.1 MAG: hypothetical protein EOR16_21925 [Mesorhizobium sp.]